MPLYSDLRRYSSNRTECINLQNSNSTKTYSESVCCVFNDNQIWILIAKATQMIPRAKYIVLLYHNFRLIIQRKIADIQYVRSAKQQPDILTKPLPEVTFTRLLFIILGW